VSAVLLVVSLLTLKKSINYYQGVKKLIEAKLRPVNKAKKRYVVFATICEERVSEREIEEAIRNNLVKHFGVDIYRKASPRIILYDIESGRGVIRVLHTCTNHLIATIGLVKQVGKTRCLIIPIRTTGTLKKAREYIRKLKI
jgi:ribonuclease P/MRP protein subunit POP5